MHNVMFFVQKSVFFHGKISVFRYLLLTLQT